MIERSKKFTIGKKSFVIEFPNVGQIIDIESMKQALTNNKYGIMAQSNVRSMYQALDIVDAVSFLSIVAPEVAKYYNVGNYMSLSPEKVKEFVDAYQRDIAPWYLKTLEELQNPLDNGETNSEGTSESEGWN